MGTIKTGDTVFHRLSGDGAGGPRADCLVRSDRLAWLGWPAVGVMMAFQKWPLSNVWLMTSVEDQAAADARIPELLATPASVRGLSCEPLLGPLELGRWCDFDRTMREGVRAPGDGDSALDWVIVGGESGAQARPCDLAWIRGVVAQCRAAGAPVFVKQLGARPVGGDEFLRGAERAGYLVEARVYCMEYSARLVDRLGVVHAVRFARVDGAALRARRDG